MLDHSSSILAAKFIPPFQSLQVWNLDLDAASMTDWLVRNVYRRHRPNLVRGGGGKHTGAVNKTCRIVSLICQDREESGGRRERLHHGERWRSERRRRRHCAIHHTRWQRGTVFKAVDWGVKLREERHTAMLLSGKHEHGGVGRRMGCYAHGCNKGGKYEGCRLRDI